MAHLNILSAIDFLVEPVSRGLPSSGANSRNVFAKLHKSIAMCTRSGVWRFCNFDFLDWNRCIGVMDDGFFYRIV